MPILEAGSLPRRIRRASEEHLQGRLRPDTARRMRCSSCQALQAGVQSGSCVTGVQAASKVGYTGRLVA